MNNFLFSFKLIMHRNRKFYYWIKKTGQKTNDCRLSPEYACLLKNEIGLFVD
jgi:hypothetical protein